MIVLATLVVVILGVGAVQLFSGSPTPPPAPPKTKAIAKQKEGAPSETTGTPEAQSGDSAAEKSPEAGDGAEAAYAADAMTKETDPMRQLYSINLPARDPFEPKMALPTDPGSTPTKAPVTQAAPRSSGRNWRGPDLNIQPMPPMQGDLTPMPGGAQMPQLGGVNGGPVGPAYSVSGVIRGDKNAAVITDAQGNQRLVKEGQSVDGDVRVESVQKGRVVLRKKDGKTITLNVGGNP